MNREVLIKSFEGADLSLNFFNLKGLDRGLSGKYGFLNIGISFMHEDDDGSRRPVRASMELDHADIDNLIAALQDAKGLLAEGYRRLVGSVWKACDENGKLLSPRLENHEHLFENSNLFETTPPPEPDAVCFQCGFKYAEHSYSEFCIDRLPDNMRRFSRTERFTL